MTGVAPVVRKLILRVSRLAPVPAFRMQPSDRAYQFRSQLYAFRVDFKTPVIDFAFSGHNIQITAWSLGVEDGTVVVLKFLEAAESALVASCFPNLAQFLLPA